MRHTFASKLARSGISLYEVSVLLGHSDPKMTQRYAHLAPNEASRRAVHVIDLATRTAGARRDANESGDSCVAYGE